MARDDYQRWRRNAGRHFVLTEQNVGGEVGTLYGWHLPYVPDVGGVYTDRDARDADAIEWGVWCCRYEEAEQRLRMGER